jgi:hypothetical protein
VPDSRSEAQAATAIIMFMYLPYINLRAGPFEVIYVRSIFAVALLASVTATVRCPLQNSPRVLKCCQGTGSK